MGSGDLEASIAFDAAWEDHDDPIDEDYIVCRPCEGYGTLENYSEDGMTLPQVKCPACGGQGFVRRRSGDGQR